MGTGHGLRLPEHEALSGGRYCQIRFILLSLDNLLKKRVKYPPRPYFHSGMVTTLWYLMDVMAVCHKKIPISNNPTYFSHNKAYMQLNEL